MSYTMGKAFSSVLKRIRTAVPNPVWLFHWNDYIVTMTRGPEGYGYFVAGLIQQNLIYEGPQKFTSGLECATWLRNHRLINEETFAAFCDRINSL